MTILRFVMAGLVVTLGAYGQADEWGLALERGRAQMRSGSFTEAERSFREALKISKARPEGPSLAVEAVTLNALGLLHDEMGKYRDAERELRLALAAIVKRAQSETDRALMISNIAGVMSHQRRYEESEERYRESIAIYVKQKVTNDPFLALTQTGLAEVLMHLNRLDEAERLLDTAIPVLVNQPEPHVAYAGLAINNLGVVRLRQGRSSEAATLLYDAVRWTERECGSNYPRLASPLNNLAVTLSVLGRVDEAAPIFVRAMHLSEKGLGAEHPLHAMVLGNYADFLKKNGRKAEGKILEAKSREVRRDSDRLNGVGMTVDASTFRLR